MNRMLRIAAAVTGVGVGLQCTGCMHTDTSTHPNQGPFEAHYDSLVDKCWPTRYSNHAQHNVIAPFAIQATNGAILDQTVWAWMFETGTDTLTAGGIEKLDYLIRRRPAPDARVFLQTSTDVMFDAKQPNKYVAARQELDGKRARVVQEYLAARTAGRGLQFEVQVIDPADPAIPSILASNASRGLPPQYLSGINGFGGTSGVVGVNAGAGGLGGNLSGAGGQSGTTAPVTGGSAGTGGTGQ